MAIERIGVVGAGQMGNGIAHVFALTGYDVVMSDLDQATLDAAMETIRGNLGRQIRKDMISEADSEAALSRCAVSGASWCAERPRPRAQWRRRQRRQRRQRR